MKEKKITTIILAIIAVLIIGGAYYYVALPAINIHAVGFWYFVIVIMAIITGIYCMINAKFTERYKRDKKFQVDI